MKKSFKNFDCVYSCLKCRLEVQKLLGHAVSDANVRKVASLAQRLAGMQSSDKGTTLVSERPANGTHDNVEFGADLVFHAPARFLVDVSLEDGELLGEESTGISSSYYEGLYSHGNLNDHYPSTDGRSFNLSWLKDACDQIVTKSSSQLSRDELAMAICRVLDSDKPGDEVLVKFHLLLLWVSLSSFCRQLISY